MAGKMQVTGAKDNLDLEAGEHDQPAGLAGAGGSRLLTAIFVGATLLLESLSDVEWDGE